MKIFYSLLEDSQDTDSSTTTETLYPQSFFDFLMRPLRKRHAVNRTSEIETERTLKEKEVEVGK